MGGGWARYNRGHPGASRAPSRTPLRLEPKRLRRRRFSSSMTVVPVQLDQLVAFLADSPRLVQYCYQQVNGCRCQLPHSVRSLRRHSPTSGNFTTFRRKGRPARASSNSVGRAGFQGMIASGRQTAPPRVREVVQVTNSACSSAFPAFSCVPDSPCAAPARVDATARRAELFLHLAPAIAPQSLRTTHLPAPR